MENIIGDVIHSYKYTNIKPLGDRVLDKIKTAEEKTDGGILVPTTAQTKPQGGEVVSTGEGKTVGKSKVDISVKIGTQIVYSKYTGTELEFNGSKRLFLKDDDIVGILESDDAKELKPLNGRVLIEVAEAEEKTTREGNRKPLSLAPGSIVMYSNNARNEFKGKDGYDYIALRVSDVMAVLS
ncbi:hypothetical protein ACB092_07G012000 [Castanea dentata]